MNKLPSIVLIGFKHVGKSTVGAELAQALNWPWIDFDQAIEEAYAQTHTPLSVREIMRLHGEDYFRQLERERLPQILEASSSAVISLGGGTVLKPSQARVIHITANKDTVFERIMAGGVPTFFPTHLSARDAFDQLWDEREKVYQQWAQVTVVNDASPRDCVERILGLNLIASVGWAVKPSNDLLE